MIGIRTWRQPPTGPTYGVDLDTELYLFDRPIRKADLQAALTSRWRSFFECRVVEPDQPD